jgi:hypothetical protein
MLRDDVAEGRKKGERRQTRETLEHCVEERMGCILIGK